MVKTACLYINIQENWLNVYCSWPTLHDEEDLVEVWGAMLASDNYRQSRPASPHPCSMKQVGCIFILQKLNILSKFGSATLLVVTAQRSKLTLEALKPYSKGFQSHCVRKRLKFAHEWADDRTVEHEGFSQETKTSEHIIKF